jgi:release factor glutamine methyltransferase
MMTLDHRGASTQSIASHLQRGVRLLSRVSDSPRLDAELLLSQVLGLSRSALIARSDEPVAAAAQSHYADLLKRRSNGAPVAYLTGRREFWSLPLNVTPAVLVPRPETEVLVELALQHLPRERAVSVLELGTGSGAISLAIASERPFVRITAVDVCGEALAVAMQNARDLVVPNIEWRLGSWFAAVPTRRFDMIVANPPYLGEADPALADLSAEPSLALIAGPTGLEALTTITAQAPSHLHPGGWLLLEHGIDQALAVAGLLESYGFCDIRSHLDFSRRPRVTLGTLHSHHQEPT